MKRPLAALCRSILLLLSLSLAPNAEAQFNLLFTTEHDLPNSLVNKVCEDDEEMIWIATEDGLCRFDGSRVTTYRHKADNPHSIQSNFIRTIFTDERGHVLIATTSGLQLYRRATDDFTPPIENREAGILAGNVSDLEALGNGDIIATGNTTFTVHFDEHDQPIAIRNPFTDRIDGTFRVKKDGRGDIWVIRFNDGAFRLDLRTDSIEAFPDVAMTCLGIGPDGELYAAGLSTGIYRYDRLRREFIEFSTPGVTFAAREMRQVPGQRQMYVGTDGNGILTLDCTTGHIQLLELDDKRIDDRTQKVHSFCIARNGELWAAIYQRGILVHVPNPLDFHYFGPHSKRFDCIGDRCITSILRAHDSRIWVSTDNGGIYCIDDAGHQLCHYPIASLPSALMTIYEDARHRMWFGSYGQGCGIIDLATGRCQLMPIEGMDGSRANIYAFAEDRRGQLWVASMGMGILRYDEARQTLQRVPCHWATGWSTSLCYDAAADCLHVGTYNGLVTIRMADFDARPSATEEERQAAATLALQGFVINSVTLIDPSHLSLSTDHGIVIYDVTDGSHTVYSTDNGLPKGGLYASEADAEGNIWISGSAGLTRLNQRQGTLTNYSVHDGLRTSEFYKNASMRDADGKLWFGGTDGITWFYPAEIQAPSSLISTRIVSLHANQNYLHPDASGRYHITYDDHSFTLELATRPILSTRRVIYRYQMDDDPWQTLLPSTNSVSFSRIASGRHTFRFQAVSGEQQSEVRQVEIHVAYPWYRSWWAWMLWMAILGLICYLLWRQWQEHVLRRQERQDEAINEAKLQFFMNIAHEFRTPMTLIVSPLQKLIASDRDPARQRSYQLIDRNANRILNLINQMMDLRRIDKAQMRLNCQRLKLVPLLREQLDIISDMSEARHVSTRLAADVPTDLQLWLDQGHFEKIILNLLSNALKYTPEGGYIEVACLTDAPSTAFPDGSVRIAVTDSGIGIPPSERDHIFERFYQVRLDSTSQSMGTGIGLSLVHALVSLHHGQIAVMDNPDGHGTRFVVTLPLGTSLYAADELNDSGGTSAETPVSNQVVTTASIVSSTLRSDLPAQAEARPAAVRHHILVADDDEEIRQYLSAELSAFFHVTTCCDGAEALDLLMKSSHSTGNAFDLVLTDLMMPGLDGLQLCQKIRGNVRLNHLPVILLTARTGDEERLRSLETGVNAFIAKPFNLQLLLQTVRNIIDNQTRLRNTFSGQQLPSAQVETPALKSPDQRLLERIVRVVNDNLSNPDLTSEFIAREVGLSRVHLYRKLKELTNQSARNYIRNIRLTKAAELLTQKKMSVSEVAYQVGFASSNSFTTAFKELYGMSPTEFMEQEER